MKSKFQIPNSKFIISIGLIGLISFVAYAHQVGNQNINSNSVGAEQFAWNDVVGWLDFHDPNIHNIEVGAIELTGWASSSVGLVALNCAKAPDPANPSNPAGINVCGSYTQPFKVVHDSQPGSGNLAGWGWNENIGWISFCGNDSGPSTWNGGASTWACPTPTSYQVRVQQDGSNAWSNFQGWGWNEVVGWVSFNCANPGTNGCTPPGSSYKVQTSAGASAKTAIIESNVFDTGGSQITFNSLAWKGLLNGGSVEFYLATANAAAGPWDYGIIPEAAYSPGGQLVIGQAYKLRGSKYVGKRYIRYKAILYTDNWQTVSPQVDDVIINWSP